MSAILHVDIVDDATGQLLASVDASSTADGLAYYLTSRRLDLNVTVTALFQIAEAAVTPEVIDDTFNPRQIMLAARRHPLATQVRATGSLPRRVLVARVAA